MPVAAHVDHVVGDQRAFKAEFRIDRDFAETFAAVGHDLDIVGGVAADRRIAAIGDAVLRHHDAAGAIDVDAVAVLAGAAS